MLCPSAIVVLPSSNREKSDDHERRGGRNHIDALDAVPSDRVLHHATGRDPKPFEKLDQHGTRGQHDWLSKWFGWLVMAVWRDLGNSPT
jgi:hypothetical protein